MNKRAFSVGYRKPVIVESSDPRNNNVNQYLSKLGREGIVKNLEGTGKLASASLTAWNPEPPAQTATITPTLQNIIGETQSYLTTSSFIASSEFLGTISYSISGEQNLPSGLQINPATGQIFGTPTTELGLSVFNITARDVFGTLASSILNLLILIKAALSPTSQTIYGEIDSLLTTTAFTPNSRFVGSPTYSLTSGTLPTGLSLNTSTGVISGTPIASLPANNFTVTANGLDFYGTSISASSSIQLTVFIKPAISPSTQTLIAQPNIAITPTTAFTPNSRFVGSVSYALSGGILPTGLSFNTATGVISGTATDFFELTNFTVTATGVDIVGQNINATAIIGITVTIPPAISPSTQTILGQINQAITPTVAFTANDVFVGTITYSYTLPSGLLLPTGLSFNTSTGVISGTPTTPLATTNISILAQDSYAHTATAIITILILSPFIAPDPEIMNTPGLTDSTTAVLLGLNTLEASDTIYIINQESDSVLTENINILNADVSDTISINQESDSVLTENMDVLSADVSETILFDSIINDSIPTSLLQPVPSGWIVVNSSTYNPQGTVGTLITTSGLTAGGTDDGYWTVILPYPITFGGISYSTIYIGTNSYITFGSGTTQYSGLSASSPALDKIMINAADRGGNNIYFQDNGTSWRVRADISNSLGGGTTDIIWELSSSISTPNTLHLDIVLSDYYGVTNVSSSTGLAYSTLGGTGTAWDIIST